MVVLCCGGRDFEDLARVTGVFEDLPPGTTIIHGDARGADRLCRDVARHLGWPERGYPAKWKEHGRSAGPIRNQQMLDEEPEIELVLAFPGGRGTWDMCQRADAKGIPILYV